MAEIRTEDPDGKPPVDLASMDVDEILAAEETRRAEEARLHQDKVRDKAISIIDQKNEGRGSYEYAVKQVETAETDQSRIDALTGEIKKLETHRDANEGKVTEQFTAALEAKKTALEAKKAALSDMDKLPTLPDLSKARKATDSKYAEDLELVASADHEVHSKLLSENREYANFYGVVERPGINKRSAEYIRAKKIVDDKRANEIEINHPHYKEAKARIGEVTKELLGEQQAAVSPETLKYGYSRIDDIPDGEDGISAEELRTDMGKVADARRIKEERLQEGVNSVLRGDNTDLREFERMIREDDPEVPVILEGLKGELERKGVYGAYEKCQHTLDTLEAVLAPDSGIDIRSKDYCYKALAGDLEDVKENVYNPALHNPIETALDELKALKEQIEQNLPKLDEHARALKGLKGGVFGREKKSEDTHKELQAVLKIIDVKHGGWGGKGRDLKTSRFRGKLIDLFLEEIDKYKQSAPAKMRLINHVLASEEDLRSLQDLTRGQIHEYGGMYSNNRSVESEMAQAIRYMRKAQKKKIAAERKQ